MELTAFWGSFVENRSPVLSDVLSCHFSAIPLPGHLSIFSLLSDALNPDRTFGIPIAFHLIVLPFPSLSLFYHLCYDLTFLKAVASSISVSRAPRLSVSPDRLSHTAYRQIVSITNEFLLGTHNTREMELAAQLKRGISRQLSTGSLKRTFSRQFTRQSSLDPRRNNMRFSFGRQSSMDPIRRSPIHDELTVPENLDSTMQLLFMACRGDVKGVEDLLNEGIDVNSIDLDGRTALHIAGCEGHVEVVKLLLSRKANIDARDRWGSTAAADAKYYGNVEVYNILKARGAKAPKTRKTPMAVANPREVPEYELNPLELQVRKSDGIAKGTYQVAKWNGTKVSVKILDKESYLDPESIEAFKHELEMLEKVRHPNVVQFVGAVTQNVPMMIVSEHHPKGDLGSYLHKKGRLSLSKSLRFALDIARGMNYLHECKPEPIIHCDLKPKNILMDSGGQLKIAGFGLLRLSTLSHDKAKLVQPEAHPDPSSLYMAPEIYKDELFDRSVDVYSFGLILYEMIEGVQPLHPKPPEEAVRMMCIEGKRPQLKVKAKSYPPDLRELIEECWHAEPIFRPTFSVIIVRLDRVVANCSKQGWWKDTFKFPWK